MNEILKIIGIGIITAILSLVVKQKKPELALCISVAGSLVILFQIIGPMQVMLEIFRDLSRKTGIDATYITLILKVIGIAYLVQFAAEITRDAGETSMASKLELAGKVCIFVLSAPVVLSLLNTIISLIP